MTTMKIQKQKGANHTMPFSTLPIKIKEECIAKLIISVGMVTLSIGGMHNSNGLQPMFTIDGFDAIEKDEGPLKPPYGYTL
ncbi:hypothetical protein HanIR_Chr06g0292241 [Helianthus annuus]|nr:hypothetical protein HanIR_Chr06g0292241 [Helianthus annuus]